MEQEDVKVCRICSIMDVKLHDLRSHPLESYYESVIGNYPQYAKLPPYACYECAALVRKFYFFRQKCLRSQAVLQSTANYVGKLKPKVIAVIDRDSLHIGSNLEIVNLPNIEVSHSQLPKPQLDLTTNLKLELGSEDEDYKFIHEEHSYAICNTTDPSISSDVENDEPLSPPKKKKSQPVKAAKKVYLEVEFEPESVGDSEEIIEVEIPKVVEKKKKPTLRVVKGKNEVNKKANLSREVKWKDLAKYVDVITLTLEEQKAEILKRKESSNYLTSPFQCNLCYKGFLDNDTWNHHIGKHAPSAGSIECEVCKFRFKTKHAFLKHASAHEKKYVCKSCPYTSKTINQAEKHQGWHKGIIFKCKYCAEIFKVFSSYMSHLRLKHPSEFICGFCGYSFVSKLGLTMHKTMMHKDVQEKDKENAEEGNPEENTEDDLYCKECDVKFISMEAYKRHVVMSVKHTESTDSIKGCRTCGAKFENSEDLGLHVRKEHSRKRPKSYVKKRPKKTWPSKCDYCEEMLATRSDYWTHFRLAHPDENYPVQKNHICEICGKGYRSNAFLTYHQLTHSKERLYKCDKCDKSFHTRIYLSVHQKSHSDRRPYPCSACDKAFKDKAALDRHFRIHTGEKPYACEICDKRFSQSDSMKLHVRTVHFKLPAPPRNRQRRKQAT